MTIVFFQQNLRSKNELTNLLGFLLDGWICLRIRQRHGGFSYWIAITIGTHKMVMGHKREYVDW
jgi:hypothetical protein